MVVELGEDRAWRRGAVRQRDVERGEPGDRVAGRGDRPLVERIEVAARAAGGVLQEVRRSASVVHPHAIIEEAP
jgi:hypothetical protein